MDDTTQECVVIANEIKEELGDISQNEGNSGTNVIEENSDEVKSPIAVLLQPKVEMEDAEEQVKTEYSASESPESEQYDSEEEELKPLASVYLKVEMDEGTEEQEPLAGPNAHTERETEDFQTSVEETADNKIAGCEAVSGKHLTNVRSRGIADEMQRCQLDVEGHIAFGKEATDEANNISQPHGPKRHICPLCNIAFRFNCYLKRHMRIHSGDKPYSCPECKKAFAKSSDLTCHLRIHTGEKPYVCVECNKAFARSSKLTSHIRIHTRERPNLCDDLPSECETTSGKHLMDATSRGIADEMQRCQLDAEGHITSDKETTDEAKNISQSQTGSKRHICPICNIAFSFNSYLKRHMRVHSGDKPYTCPECNKAFAKSSDLTCHIRIHTGVKPYVCVECNKAFTSSSNLTSHIKIHTRE